ncbi:iron-containing alcohol dehydrogenase [Aggregatilinea lenta]|uniref:iron-containing alcohol dehydrogenase n=1 Tax=Aggregatilinea lenta TaxID=913108 RepID=UPI000E5BD299|nr:iron-containing alcohol dehydrogenase [Aggregatilinea lenta]
MRFEFATAGRIVFGPGMLKEAGPLAATLGRRAFVVTGANVDRAQPLLNTLVAAGLTTAVFPVSGEPTTHLAQDGADAARAFGAELVIGFGGGSALDAGKAIAALVRNTDPLLDYLEVIGRGQPMTEPSVPMLAIPTTAGTGTEVTRNAVLASPEHRVKVSLRSASMLPAIALVDPELTHSVPPDVTAYTGLDTLTQIIEPLLSVKRNPLADALARQGLLRAAGSLQQAYEAGDPAAREQMALASLCGGLAMANAGLGAVHGFAGPFGGMFDAPHGAVCAAFLPHVMQANVDAIRARAADTDLPARLNEIAQNLTGDPTASAEDGVQWVRDLCAVLHIPPLRTYGITPADFPTLVEKGRAANSMKGNPLVLTDSELIGIVKAAY